jgi:rare lipoprotein A (peptidoglycan hydrolase)
LRYRPSVPGRERLRVRFAGDRTNAAVSTRAGSLTVYHQTLASWYYDGGTTACGFHAYYGVANLSLPCGTVVSFSHGGRRVQAVVDDRGPYVGGRTWDLNQNTAAALGFGGVGAVWSSR